MPRPGVRRLFNGPVHAPQGAAYYEALRESPDRTPMVPAPLGSHLPIPLTTGLSRLRLSGLAHALYDNGGFVAYAVNQIALYSVPIVPQAASPDNAWNRAAEAYFADWSKRSDYVGRLDFDFYSLQFLLSQGIDLDGDVGVMMALDAGFPQVQLVEGWRIGTNKTSPVIKHVDGVILDAKGRVGGYVIETGGQPVRVSASEMMLVRDPSMTSPLRGVSPMRRGMNDIRDYRDTIGFEKIGVKHNSALLGVIEGGFLDEDHGFKLEDPEGTDPSSPMFEGEKNLSRADMLGGDIPVLDAGRKFARVESNRPNAGFGEFMSTLVGSFAAGLDMPPAFFLDQKLTGPNARSVNAKAQRKFDQRQVVIGRFVEWAWVRVIAHAIEHKELPAVDGWTRITLQRPARITIDAGREAQQERDDQGRGLLTRQESFGGRGRDWQRETDQVFAEDDYIIDRAKAQSERTGVPLATILARWGFQDSKPVRQEDDREPEADEAEETDETDEP